MYVTATAPYIFMLILLINGALLPGASTGFIYYLKPNFTKLRELEVSEYWYKIGPCLIFFFFSSH